MVAASDPLALDAVDGLLASVAALEVAHAGRDAIQERFRQTTLARLPLGTSLLYAISPGQSQS